MLFKRKPNTKISIYTRFSSYRRKRDISIRRERTSIDRVISSNPIKKSAKFLLITLLVLGSLYLGYLIFATDFFKVKTTEVISGKDDSDNNLIKSEINIFKGESIFSINKVELTKELLAKYPEIETIKIKKRLPSTLELHILKYEPKANLKVFIENIERKYILNSIGYIAYSDTEDPDLPTITMQREKAYNSREKVMEQDELNNIIKAQILFEQKFLMKVTEIKYLEIAREFHMKTEKDFFVWLDLTQDYKSQLSKLKASEQKLNIHTTPLQYIDLRVAGNQGEKVIFKRK